MPKPVFKRINLLNIIKDNVFLLKEIDSSIKIELTHTENEYLFTCDSEQISESFLILLKIL